MKNITLGLSFVLSLMTSIGFAQTLVEQHTFNATTIGEVPWVFSGEAASSSVVSGFPLQELTSGGGPFVKFSRSGQGLSGVMSSGVASTVPGDGITVDYVLGYLPLAGGTTDFQQIGDQIILATNNVTTDRSIVSPNLGTTLTVFSSTTRLVVQDVANMVQDQFRPNSYHVTSTPKIELVGTQGYSIFEYDDDEIMISLANADSSVLMTVPMTAFVDSVCGPALDISDPGFFDWLTCSSEARQLIDPNNIISITAFPPAGIDDVHVNLTSGQGCGNPDALNYGEVGGCVLGTDLIDLENAIESITEGVDTLVTPIDTVIVADPRPVCNLDYSDVYSLGWYGISSSYVSGIDSLDLVWEYRLISQGGATGPRHILDTIRTHMYNPSFHGSTDAVKIYFTMFCQLPVTQWGPGSQNPSITVGNFEAITFESINVMPDILTSVGSSHTETKVSAFPNPTTGTMTLTKEMSWILRSTYGTQLASGQSDKVDLNQFNAGMYILETADGTIISVLKQ